MAGDGTLATTAIITKGLVCGPCTGSPFLGGSPDPDYCGGSPLTPCRTGLITTPFSLYCTVVPPPPEPPPPEPIAGAGGGPYPRDAWNKFGPGDIQNFYQPVPDEMQYYIVPRDKEAQYFRRYKHVVMHLKMGKFEVEKEYAVPDQQARAVIQVLSLLNTTKDRITMSVKNIRRLASRMVVTISNLRLRRPHK